MKISIDLIKGGSIFGATLFQKWDEDIYTEAFAGRSGESLALEQLCQESIGIVVVDVSQVDGLRWRLWILWRLWRLWSCCAGTMNHGGESSVWIDGGAGQSIPADGTWLSVLLGGEAGRVVARALVWVSEVGGDARGAKGVATTGDDGVGHERETYWAVERAWTSTRRVVVRSLRRGMIDDGWGEERMRMGVMVLGKGGSWGKGKRKRKRKFGEEGDGRRREEMDGTEGTEGEEERGIVGVV